MAGLPTARMPHKPLEKHEAVPTTPGRIALLFACAGIVTFGILSPIALVVSFLALLQKFEAFALAGFLISLIAVLVWVDMIFFGGLLVVLFLGVFGGP